MNDAILLQHAYPNTPPDDSYLEMIELTRERNEAYCRRWGFDFRAEIFNDPAYPAISGSWIKIKLMLEAIRDGYRYIAWLDPDALIWDLETDLRDAIAPNHIGSCWHRIPQFPQGHWNVGVLYADNSAAVRDFLTAWLDSYPAPPDGWNEQGVFNRLALKDRTVVTLSDRWNATLDVNMVPDAVVLGYHGQGLGTSSRGKVRLELMRATLEREKVRV